MGRKLEFISGLQLALWGAWLLLPLDSFTTTKVFRLLSQVAPEWVWGIVPFIAGLLWLFCKNLKTRQHLAFFAMFFWLVISITFIIGNFFSTATVIYPMQIIISMLAFDEINKEAKWILQP